jgi:hypothetical protein
VAEDRLPAGEDAWDAVDNIVTLTLRWSARRFPPQHSAGHPAGTSEKCDFRPDGRTRWTRQPRRLLLKLNDLI